MQILKQIGSGVARRSIRTRLFAVALLCGIFVIAIPASSAPAGADFQYATGVLGVGAFYHTGFDNRNYNRAWHQPGYSWSIWYGDVNGFTSCSVQSNTNPTRCETNSSYKQAWCHNVNDNSDVTWSCNTTHGFSLFEKPPNGSRSSLNPATDTAGGQAREVLTAFRGKRTSVDRMPLALEHNVADETRASVGAPAAAQPGTAITNQSRALLSGLGSRSETLYAIPTDTGGVCMALTSHGALGCVDRFSSSQPYGWEVRDADQMGTGEPAIVTGLVPPSVSSVWIRVDEASERATVGRGGFFYELKDSEVWPEAIEFRYADGTESVVTVAWPG